MQNQAREDFEHGARRISPFFIPMIIPNMAGGALSIRYGFEGPNHAVVSACATGNHALAEGLSLIREGQADLILCGGSEASVSEMGIGGFNAMKALSTRNDVPEAAGRPFDVDRELLLRRAHADHLTATSTKSMTGHLLGAAGAIEAIATVLSIVHGVVPPTINLAHQDPACDVNVATNQAVHRTVRVALNNAFGFGGHNTCAVFSALE